MTLHPGSSPLIRLNPAINEVITDSEVITDLNPSRKIKNQFPRG